ncbi:permease-like cell division protein FtsX [Candidatus Saccharibacteria bacterium]|nr:permease-like cell division protein FtsX [Candidatus Saccharibacteria bacterium]
MANNENRQTSKRNIRRMAQSEGSHVLRDSARVLKYGTANFARNFWLSAAATAVMTITLILLFLTAAATIVLSETADSMREKIDITIFLKPGTKDATLGQLTEIISEDKNVKSVVVANSEQEFAAFLEENKDNAALMETLEDEEMKEIMLKTMQSTMRLKVYNVEDLTSIKSIVESDPLFVTNLDEKKEPTYDVNASEIATITSWANIAKNGGLVLSAIFLTVSILIIFNTIRMAIFSRREEIYMEKLIGASTGFIRGPFIVEARIYGIIAGLISATLCYFAFHFASPALNGYGINTGTIEKYLESSYLILFYLAMVALGMLIGSLSAHLALHRYLKKA